jgi:hypothetical protein
MKLAAFSAALLAGLVSSSALLAQPWERAYGVKDQVDVGQRRVTPVTQCPGGGYISIGSRDLGNVSSVYVIRTDNAGGTIWEQYYDVGYDGRPDEGFALAELKHGGWVTTGTSNRGNRNEAHAMKLNCDGKVLWSYFYYLPSLPPLVGYRLTGHDIRELQSGDGITTNAGDLAIAGFILDQNLRADAALLRIDQFGNLIWHRRYDLGRNERFLGLAEMRPTYSHAGEIVAVGEFNDGFNHQAIAARIDGVTGAFGGGPDQGWALYGDGGDEFFYSVVETQTWPDTGLLTFAGLSTSPGLNDDVYVVQSKPHPCGGLTQVTIGNETGDPFGERALDLIEVLEPSGAAPVGSFALTGAAETKYSRSDAFLLFLRQSSLFPLQATRYGDHSHYVDFGTSLAQNQTFGPQGPGFIIAGTTETDWDGSADPSDLYLVQTTDTGKTGCEKDWYPDPIYWNWTVKCPLPQVTKFLRQIEVDTKVFRDDTAVRACN